MSTTAELAVREGVVITPAERAAAAAGAGMDSWLIVMKDVVLLAEHICDTPFVPKAYRGNAPAAAAAILTGRELGMPPMTSLRHVQVVEGVPSLDAEYKRARVLAAGHEFDILQWDGEHCKVSGRRRGSHKPPLEVEYTMKDARIAGLVRDRSKYVTAPRVMMLARATTLLCNAIFADVTNGLATTELLESGDADVLADVVPLEIPAAPEPQRVTAEQVRARRTVTGATVTEDTPPAPPQGPPAAAGPPPAAAPGAAGGAGGALIASGQKHQIEEHFRRIGTDLDSPEGWDAMLEACAALAGLANLGDLQELTQPEAAKVIRELRKLKDGEAGARALQALLRDGVKAVPDGG